jgi:hypothetical protein
VLYQLSYIGLFVFEVSCDLDKGNYTFMRGICQAFFGYIPVCGADAI